MLSSCLTILSPATLHCTVTYTVPCTVTCTVVQSCYITRYDYVLSSCITFHPPQTRQTELVIFITRGSTALISLHDCWQVLQPPVWSRAWQRDQMKTHSISDRVERQVKTDILRLRRMSSCLSWTWPCWLGERRESHAAQSLVTF